MALHVYGIGTASPPHAISQDEAARVAARFGATSDEQQRQLRALHRLSHVKKRHSVLLEADGEGSVPRPIWRPPGPGDDERGPGTSERMAIYERETPALAARAASAALAESGLHAREITHLVTASCTGFAAPGFDIGLIRALDLARDVARTHVGFMGCHGSLNALRVAQGYADAAPDARVLVCAVELCSLHYQYGWNPDWLVANTIFADGSAALVGGGAPRGAEDAWQLARSGGALLEDAADLMSWRIGDHGFEMALSARVPGVIGRELRPYLEAWLRGQDLGIEGIGSWAIHPGGPRILEGCAQALGLREEDTATSREVLGEFGNMSSPTILFILDRLRRRAAPRPCVAIAFGPGLSVEAALFR